MDATNSFATRCRAYDAAALAEAARLVAEGQPIAVATETVYGLAADATNPRAVAAIYAAKGRPSFNPLIVHVASLAAAEALADFDAGARALAEAFWPGPLTLVLPARTGSGIASLVTAGLPTIAIRVPAHRAIQGLIEASGKPLAAPSANASGGISPTRAAHVLMSLEGRIALVLDDGPCPEGLESTIVLTGNTPRLLRPGPISAAAIAAVLGQPLANAVGGIIAPGQLASHYAPAKPLRLDATDAGPDEWLIGFGAVSGDDTLSATGDLTEAAASLFDTLHGADASGKPRIAVAPVPDEGLGAAINDRLARAAH
ncbi:MAG: threonylcarbamoyl-AMP synthase [Sphingomonas sp.]|uniref:L-threonylcarbamoyladenylate synthase n=1 Tax=Sphingomonas sp. TaxID=28214 RepID=UPI0025ED84A6|nr:L-threonylcarbamoyladenylate synthase [Sphingomonas sp.]MBY0282420.1 threonylcarbamoyl-AMP synthase [Sphingomonas sp.]